MNNKQQNNGTVAESVGVVVGSETETPTPSASLTERMKESAKEAPVVESAASRIRKSSAIAAQANKAKQEGGIKQKRTQATYAVQRPGKGRYIRVHPDPEYRIREVPVIEDKETNKVYFVEGAVIAELPSIVADQVRYANFYMAQSHDGAFFLWPVYRSNTTWYEGARRAASMCTKKWYAIQAQKSASTYTLISPEGVIPEPEWSSLPKFDEILDSAFGDNIIATVEHPLIQRMMGKLAVEDSCDDGF